MLMCNCTLGIDNPEVCKRCSAYINYYKTEMPQYIYEVYDFNLGSWYNPETHELVEKKDYKIKELEKKKDPPDNYKTFIIDMNIKKIIRKGLCRNPIFLVFVLFCGCCKLSF